MSPFEVLGTLDKATDELPFWAGSEMQVKMEFDLIFKITNAEIMKI